MKQHAFLACHPSVNLLYFVLVLTFSMFFLHPLCLTVSLFSALWCAAELNGGAARHGAVCGKRMSSKAQKRRNGLFGHGDMEP